jgi:hypothetical protein
MNSIFDPKALEANRKGKLTLLQSIRFMPWLLFGAIMFLMGLGLTGIYIYNDFIARTTSDTVSVVLGAVFFVGVGIVLMWIGYMIGGKLLIDLLFGQLRKAQGRGMKHSAWTSKGRENLYYSVGELKLTILWDGIYRALPDGDFVTAYYLPRSKMFINLETSNVHFNNHTERVR